MKLKVEVAILGENLSAVVGFKQTGLQSGFKCSIEQYSTVKALVG